MTEITHKATHALLQAAVDRPLAATEKAALEAHLAGCKECSEYADRLANLEVTLRQALHEKWDDARPNLNLQTIKNPSAVKFLWNYLFSQTQAFGKATVIAALVLGYFVIVNLVGFRVQITNDETPTVLPTPNATALNSVISPTPSIQTSQIGKNVQACKTVLYVVQENDTLESIAVHHGTTTEAILEYNLEDNSLTAETVFTGKEIRIPRCESTPSRTASIPANLRTTTPPNGTILPE
jgi:LysM repeat protein